MTRTPPLALRVGISSLTIAAFLTLAPSASAATTWVVDGAGYGHGVGMSAYGAYGYGKHGFDHRQILNHYFYGIRISEMRRPPLVRVLLKVSSGDVSFGGATAACGQPVSPSGSYRARRRGSGLRLLSASGKTLASCGKRMQADGGGKIRVRGVGTYRGALVVVPSTVTPGSLNVINQLDVNDYVEGSVPVEVPPSWPAATLRAMAIAARSIALSSHVGGKAFDLYSDTRSQVYGGRGVETKRTNDAVRQTRNQVATFKGEVAQTTYFSSSGGRTESGFLGAPDVPYLKSVADPYDYYAPRHRWKFRFSQAAMDSRLGRYVRGGLREIKVIKRGDSPRIDYAKLVGTQGTTTVRGDTLRAALGLYDRWAFFKKVRTGG
jgi:stage II sporulation protein D